MEPEAGGPPEPGRAVPGAHGPREARSCNLRATWPSQAGIVIVVVLLVFLLLAPRFGDLAGRQFTARAEACIQPPGQLQLGGAAHSGLTGSLFQRLPPKIEDRALQAGARTPELDAKVQRFVDTGDNTEALIRRIQLAELKSKKHEVDTERLKAELDKAMTLAERAVQESERLRSEHKEEKLWWAKQAEEMRTQMQELVDLHRLDRLNNSKKSASPVDEKDRSSDSRAVKKTDDGARMDNWVSMCEQTISQAAGACTSVRALQGEMMSGIRCAERGGSSSSQMNSDIFSVVEGGLSTRLGATMAVFGATVDAMASYVKHVKKVAIDATQGHSQLKKEINALRRDIKEERSQNGSWKENAKSAVSPSHTTSAPASIAKRRSPQVKGVSRKAVEKPPESPSQKSMCLFRTVDTIKEAASRATGIVSPSWWQFWRIASSTWRNFDTNADEHACAVATKVVASDSSPSSVARLSSGLTKTHVSSPPIQREHTNDEGRGCKDCGEPSD